MTQHFCFRDAHIPTLARNPGRMGPLSSPAGQFHSCSHLQMHSSCCARRLCTAAVRGPVMPHRGLPLDSLTQPLVTARLTRVGNGVQPLRSQQDLLCSQTLLGPVYGTLLSGGPSGPSLSFRHLGPCRIYST